MAANLFSLEGKNIVVVGGGGGMGSSVAKGMLEYGGNVALADISPEGLERAAKWLTEETGQDVRTYSVTATEEESVAKLVADAVADMGSRGRTHQRSGLQRQESGDRVPRGPVDQALRHQRQERHDLLQALRRADGEAGQR